MKLQLPRAQGDVLKSHVLSYHQSSIQSTLVYVKENHQSVICEVGTSKLLTFFLKNKKKIPF